MSKQPYSFRSLFQDLQYFLRPYRGRFWLATFLRVISDISNLYPTYAFAAIVSFFASYAVGSSLTPVWILLSLSASSYVLRYLTIYGAKRIMFSVSEQVAINAQLEAVDHMYRLPALWHEKENTGNKLTRIINGSRGIDRILRIWVQNIIEIGVNLVGIIIIIATVDKVIAFSVGVFMIAFYFLSRAFISRAGKASEAVNIANEEVNGLSFESLNNIRTVQVLDMAKALHGLLQKQTQKLYQKIMTRIFWFQTGNVTRGLSGHLFQLVMIAYIVWGISQGQYEVGFLVLFANYFNRIWSSVNELSDVMQDLVVARYSVGRLMYILKTPARPTDESLSIPMPEDWETISLNDVSFSYNDTEVLKKISLTINRGEKVGLVGLSGAGKSTLFKLLLREYEPDSGKVCIDEKPLHEIRRGEYLKQVATVLQDTEVFNMSLKQNITLARKVSDKKGVTFDRALKISHVEEFVSKLPQGVDTKIGEKGVKLSGGERQRLGIARAVYKNPSLLLMDEATSHLDVESEEKIKDSLHTFFQSVTAVVIAHRLSTIQEMDRIIVLENGTIVEEGNFKDLLKKKGRFFELWEKQRL